MDNVPSARLTRRELYERLWDRPATAVAKELGISDVEMIHLCQQHNVPKPWKGYWTTVRHGGAVERPALPPASASELEIIEISPEKRPKAVHRLESPEVIAPKPPASPVREPTEESRAVAAIRVEDTLRNPHKLVAHASRSLRAARVDTDGYARPTLSGTLSVHVSPSQISRAMRIMNALIREAETRGYAFVVKDEGQGSQTYLKVGDIELKFRLSEMRGEFEKKLTAADRKQYEGLSAYTRRWYTHEKRPRGEFSLSLEGHYGTARTWYEKGDQRLETKLGSVLDTAARMAVRVADATREAEERQRQWKLEEERRREEQRRREEEQARREQLAEQVEHWRVARLVRSFVAHARRRAAVSGTSDDLEHWLGWASEYADKLDPLRNPVTALPARSKKEPKRAAW